MGSSFRASMYFRLYYRHDATSMLTKCKLSCSTYDQCKASASSTDALIRDMRLRTCGKATRLPIDCKHSYERDVRLGPFEETQRIFLFRARAPGMLMQIIN
jgi:hypothetical protein